MAGDEGGGDSSSGPAHLLLGSGSHERAASSALASTRLADCAAATIVCAWRGSRSCGARRSGRRVSPIHWHNDAVNYAVHGAKLWTLLPPLHAVYMYSRRHATVDTADFFLHKNSTSALHCAQRAGDLMFVPDGEPSWRSKHWHS
eukprot:COSAG02_NODE_72_length_41961_cov_13.243658_6_plen_145_part_00